MPRLTRQKTVSEADQIDSLVIGGEKIPSGSRKDIEILVGRLPAGTPLMLPVVVHRGARKGPVLLVDAAIHGDEINGLEIILSLMPKLDTTTLAGTVILAPVVNVFGMATQSRYLPDRRDLNRSFPGSPTGSLAARLANLFLTEVASHANVIIDIHTGSLHRANLPQIRTNLDVPRNRELAVAFGAPIMVHSKERDGSLRQTAMARGIPCLVYEAGEPSRFDVDAVRCGLGGIARILDLLGMTASGTKPPADETLEVRTTSWVRAKHSGILRPESNLGDRVGKGALLGAITDTFGRKVDRVTSPFNGVILGMQLNPLVYRGDALFHVASLG